MTRPIHPALTTRQGDRDLVHFLDNLATDYDQWEGGLHRRLGERLVELVDPRVGDSCLDMGSGTGVVTRGLAEAVGDGGSVISIDICERLLDTTRPGAADNTHVMAMASDDVMFRTGAFDVVTLSRSIGYEADIPAVLAEAHRILRPGGRMALFCRRRGLATEAEQVFLATLADHAKDSPVRIPPQFFDYPGLSDRAELEESLHTTGFDEVRFVDMVSGGRAENARDWNEQMVRCWPAAHILVGSLRGSKRAEFELRLADAMAPLRDDAFRYHHAYLFTIATKAPAS